MTNPAPKYTLVTWKKIVIDRGDLMGKFNVTSIINSMKRSNIITIIVSIVVISLLLPQTIRGVMHIIKIRPLDNKIIVIDPGHGGIDGGTNISGILEKDINLSVSLKLKDLL